MSAETINLRFIHVPSTALILSLILHGAAMIMMLTAHLIDTWGIRIFPRPDYNKDLVQSYVQVDVVGLPEHLIGDQKFVDPAAPISEFLPAVPTQGVPETFDKPSSLDLREKSKRATALNLQKEQASALKQLEDEARREKALKQLVNLKESKTARSKLAGNIVSKGTATQGKIGADSEQYRSLITHLIREHFNIFLWQKSKALTSIVRIRIDRKGSVVEKKLLKSSGDTRYDTAVFTAIDESQPLPVPKEFSIVAEGITLEFKPED